MRPMLLALIVSALSFSLGCAPDRAIPNPLVPHRLSQPTQASVWVRTDKGDLQEQQVEVPAGWWLASPQLIESGR